MADEAKQKLSALADADKMRLHRARVLDAESRTFWSSVKSELSAGIAEYDSCLMGTAIEQKRFFAEDGDMITIKWRYPQPQEVVVAFDFERRVIGLEKKNLIGPGKASKTFRLSVDADDRLFACEDQNAPVGGPTEMAQAILEFTLAGSMV